MNRRRFLILSALVPVAGAAAASEYLLGHRGGGETHVEPPLRPPPTTAASTSTSTSTVPPAPAPRQLLGFASHVGGAENAEQYVRLLASANVGLLRDDLSWSSLSREHGSYDLDLADILCGLARKYGMRVIPQIGYAPSWANGGAEDKTGPLDPGDYARWAGAIAGYLDRRYGDVVAGVEYWNEPNTAFLVNPDGGAAGDPEYYVQLANAAYDEIKAAAPALPVIAGSTAPSGDWLGWTRDVLEAGLRFDEWSHHPYMWGQADGGTAGNTAAEMTSTTNGSGWARTFWGADNLADVLASHGYDGPIHATECGCPTDCPDGTPVPRGTPEAEQAKWLGLAAPLWRGRPRAGHFCVYTGQDSDSWNTVDPETHFGAFRSDGAEKPIVSVMRTL